MAEPRYTHEKRIQFIKEHLAQMTTQEMATSLKCGTTTVQNDIGRARASEIVEVKKALEDREKEMPLPPQPTRGLAEKYLLQKQLDREDEAGETES